jgi:hypothetical protein
MIEAGGLGDLFDYHLGSASIFRAVQTCFSVSLAGRPPLRALARAEARPVASLARVRTSGCLSRILVFESENRSSKRGGF